MEIEPMIEPVVAKFSSHESAAEAEVAYYRSLRPEERMAIFFDLLSQVQDDDADASQGFPRGGFRG